MVGDCDAVWKLNKSEQIKCIQETQKNLKKFKSQRMFSFVS